MLFNKNVIFMKLIQYNEYSVSAFVADGLVLQHQGISSHIAEYIPMCFQRYMG